MLFRSAILHTQGGGVCQEKIPLPEAFCCKTELRPSPKGVRWFLKLTIAYFAKANAPWNRVGAEAQVPFLHLQGQPLAERHQLAPGPQGNAFSGSLLPLSGLKGVQPPLPFGERTLQSWPTLCDPIDGSPLGSSVPGILQARTLEWVAISFSNAQGKSPVPP